MKVNSNFMNLARLVLTMKQMIGSEVILHLDFMMIITQYSMNRLTDFSYIENDENYIYNIDEDSFLSIITDAKVFISKFKSDPRISALKQEFKDIIIKSFNDVILNKKYDYMFKSITFKEVKINLLKEKINQLILDENYLECIPIRDEINLLIN